MPTSDTPIDVLAGQSIGLLLALTQAYSRYFSGVSDLQSNFDTTKIHDDLSLNDVMIANESFLAIGAYYATMLEGLVVLDNVSLANSMSLNASDLGVAIDDIYVAPGDVRVSEEMLNDTVITVSKVVPNRSGQPIGLLLTLTRPDTSASRVGTPMGLLLALTQSVPLSFLETVAGQDLSVTDMISHVAILNDGSSEISSSVDNSTASSVLIEFLPETATIDESPYTAILMALEAMSDPSSVSSSSVSSKTVSASSSNPLSVADTVASLLGLNRTIGDTSAIVEAVSTISAYTSTLSDSFAVASIASSLAQFIKSQKDTTSVSDGVEEIFPGFAKSSDLATLLDDNSSGSLLQTQTDDANQNSDGFTFENRVFMSGLDENTTQDGVDSSATSIMNVGESSSLTEVFASLLSGLQSVSDGMGAVDIVRGAMSITKSFADQVIASEASKSRLNIASVVGDVVVPMDITQVTRIINRLTNDAIQVSETLNVSQILFPTVLDVTPLADRLITAAALIKFVGDDLVLRDQITIELVLPTFLQGALRLSAALCAFLTDDLPTKTDDWHIPERNLPEGPMTFFVSNTNELRLVGLRAAVDGEFINTATVNVTINDSTGSPAQGSAWPLPMYHVDGTDGDYDGLIPAGVMLVAGRRYKAIVNVDAGSNRTAHFEYDFIPRTRVSL